MNRPGRLRVRHTRKAGQGRGDRGGPGLGQWRRSHKAGDPLLLRPDHLHLLLVLRAERRCRRVIHRRRLLPVAGLRVKRLEELRRISGIRLRVERQFQVREGVRVVHQVDLPAADVDRSDPVRLHGTDRGHRLGLGIVENALALGVHGPRPGVHGAGGRVASAALHPADRGQQMCRDAAAPLRRGDR